MQFIVLNSVSLLNCLYWNQITGNKSSEFFGIMNSLLHNLFSSGIFSVLILTEY